MVIVNVFIFLADAAYEETCQQLLDRKDAMMSRYRYLLMMESMVRYLLVVSIDLFVEHYCNSVAFLASSSVFETVHIEKLVRQTV